MKPINKEGKNKMALTVGKKLTLNTVMFPMAAIEVLQKQMIAVDGVEY